MKYILIGLVMLLVGCQDDSRDKLTQRASMIVYSKDVRTGTCYAHYRPTHSDSFTYVPCTPQIEALIK